MTIPNINFYRKECSYCFRTSANDYIYACSCSVPICSLHKSVHTSKPGHKLIFSVQNDVLVFESEYKQKLEEEHEDTGRMEEHLLRMIRLKGERECCSHSTTPQKIIYNETRCLSKKMKCDVQDLWVCFTCGYSACGRKQVYLEGNNHMEAHYKESKHSKAVRNDMIYCYVCEKYVYDVNFDDVNKLVNYAQIKEKNAAVYEMIREVVKLNEEQKDNLFNVKEIDYELDYEEPDQKSVHIPGYKGIANNGNTCYISCVFQLLAHILSLTTFHFLKCSANPFSCLLCQITRVCRELKSTEKSLKELTENTGTDYINIKDLIRCLQRDGLVIDGVQQDFSELLFLVLERLRSEEMNEIECGVNELLIGLVIREWCDGCENEKLSDSEQYFVILSEKPQENDECKNGDKEKSEMKNENQQGNEDKEKNGRKNDNQQGNEDKEKNENNSKQTKILDEHTFGQKFYFFEEECLGECSCGGTRRRNTLVNKLPDRLIIINNHRMVNNEFITNNHIPARLDLSDLIYKSKVNEKLVDEILSLGFSRHEIQRALSLMNNNLNKSIELLLNKGGEVSDNSEFELFGGVKYYATGMNNGHYIYVRDNVVIDDKDIRKVKVNEKFYKHFLVLVYKSAADVD